MDGFIGHAFYAKAVTGFLELVEMKVRILSCKGLFHDHFDQQ
jgi:hypothetical protein